MKEINHTEDTDQGVGAAALGEVMNLIERGIRLLTRMIVTAVLEEIAMQASKSSQVRNDSIVSSAGKGQAVKLVLSVEETARVLGLSRPACYQAVRFGQIPSIRIGRRIIVPWHALSRFLETAEAHREG